MSPRAELQNIHNYILQVPLLKQADHLAITLCVEARLVWQTGIATFFITLKRTLRSWV